MTSAAQFLYDFFTAKGQAQNGRDFRALYAATNELEDELNALALVGGNVKSFLALIPRIRKRLSLRANAELSKIVLPVTPGSTPSAITLEEADLGLLDLAIERTQMAGTLTPERNESIRELIAAVKEQVANDETLDPQLRLFIARALLGVEAALVEYDTTGEFKLRDALVTLFGLLRAAEATSEKPAAWREAWDKYGVPAAAGLIASIPQIALSGATLLQALGTAAS